jgi:hypothetical protein
MSVKQSNLLNLELAWKRIKLDIPHRVFIHNPFEIQIIEHNLTGYLDSLSELIRVDKYNPKPILIHNVPKGKGLLRPGAQLGMEDRLVYYACLGSCMPNIFDTQKWSQGDIEFSTQISNDFENAQWLKNQFVGWNNFRKKSIGKIDEGFTHVIIADISGYYENIDIFSLISDLRTIGAPNEVITLLSTCLNRWSQISGRGIPQGYTPSDFLGKLYLNSIDLNFKAMDIDHLRYVDDIRIFCQSKVEAKKALIELNNLFRKRGLNFQSAKTRIHTAEEARKIIDGVQPILQSILKEFVDDIIEISEIDNPYLSVGLADELLEKIGDETPITVIKKAFNKYFIKYGEEFDKTLFRFLVNRLGSSKDDYALKYCLEILETHPEETQTILKYIKSIEAISTIENTILDFINSENSVYLYQVYEILRWFSEYSTKPTENLISISRKFAFDKSKPLYLKSVCRKLIGNFGTSADLERLECLYSEIDNENEKSEIICCLKNMEITRRNGFLARAKNDGDLIRRAVELVKANSI